MIVHTPITPFHKCRNNCTRKECLEKLLYGDPMNYERCCTCKNPFKVCNGLELDVSTPRGLKVLHVYYVCKRCWSRLCKKFGFLMFGLFDAKR